MTAYCPHASFPIGEKGGLFFLGSQVELFFKWIKQNLSIKHFLGNSINAVSAQIWIAGCVYLIVIITRKQ